MTIKSAAARAAQAAVAPKAVAPTSPVFAAKVNQLTDAIMDRADRSVRWAAEESDTITRVKVPFKASEYTQAMFEAAKSKVTAELEKKGYDVSEFKLEPGFAAPFKPTVTFAFNVAWDYPR
jgi:hypothetical protein